MHFLWIYLSPNSEDNVVDLCDPRTKVMAVLRKEQSDFFLPGHIPCHDTWWFKTFFLRRNQGNNGESKRSHLLSWGHELELFPCSSPGGSLQSERGANALVEINGGIWYSQQTEAPLKLAEDPGLCEDDESLYMHSLNSATFSLIWKIHDDNFRFVDGMDLASSFWFSTLFRKELSQPLLFTLLDWCCCLKRWFFFRKETQFWTDFYPMKDIFWDTGRPLPTWERSRKIKEEKNLPLSWATSLPTLQKALGFVCLNALAQDSPCLARDPSDNLRNSQVPNKNSAGSWGHNS